MAISHFDEAQLSIQSTASTCFSTVGPSVTALAAHWCCLLSDILEHRSNSNVDTTTYEPDDEQFQGSSRSNRRCRRGKRNKYLHSNACDFERQSVPEQQIRCRF